MGDGKKNRLMKNGCAQNETFKSNFKNRTKATLHEFPNVNYYMGWIPRVFENTPIRIYKFVHIDLDLFEPLYHSLDFFFPQLVSGGCIIIDDYGFTSWPGAKMATDQWAKENGCSVIRLITGNAAIMKP